MLKAKDVMTRRIFTVTKSTPIYEAVELAVEKGISAMPVVAEDMSLAGILSEKDLIRLVHEEEATENKTVSDFMTQPAISFEQDENLLDVCDFLMKNIFRRVPITSNGRLVGIISIRDILEYVLDRRRQSAGKSE